MKTTWLTAIVVSALLISSVATACLSPVEADSTDSIRFDSGVTVFSPQNTTYYYSSLVLNLSLYGAGIMGGLDPQISMNYNIDGAYNGSVPLKSNGEIHVVTRAIATINLPEVPDGSHHLTIYLYGLNQRTHEPKYLSYVNTIYFSTASNPALSPTPTSSPTSSPSPTLTQSPASTPSVTVTSTSTPLIPEFSSWTILLSLIIMALLAGLFVYFKKR